VLYEPYIPAKKQGEQGKIDWKPHPALPDPYEEIPAHRGLVVPLQTEQNTSLAS